MNNHYLAFLIVVVAIIFFIPPAITGGAIDIDKTVKAEKPLELPAEFKNAGFWEKIVVLFITSIADENESINYVDLGIDVDDYNQGSVFEDPNYEGPRMDDAIVEGGAEYDPCCATNLYGELERMEQFIKSQAQSIKARADYLDKQSQFASCEKVFTVTDCHSRCAQLEKSCMFGLVQSSYFSVSGDIIKTVYDPPDTFSIHPCDSFGSGGRANEYDPQGSYWDMVECMCC